MVKFLMIPVLLFTLLASSLSVNADELVTESATTVTEGAIDTEQVIREQLELIEAIVTGLFAAFLGTSTFALILRFALRKLIRAAEERVRLAEEENKIGSATAKQIYSTLDLFQRQTNQRIDQMTKTFQEMDVDVKELIDEFKKRDQKLGELIKENLLDEETADE